MAPGERAHTVSLCQASCRKCEVRIPKDEVGHVSYLHRKDISVYGGLLFSQLRDGMLVWLRSRSGWGW